jgi:hypothetical protein
MAKKFSKYKDGNKTTTITIEDWPPTAADQSGSDVEAYMAQDAGSESVMTFEIIDGNKRLTITIAE